MRLLLLAVIVMIPVIGQAVVKIEKVAYKGWPHCIRMSNGDIEMIITADVGPRIIRFGFIGGDNEFKEYADQVGKSGGKEWRIYGGHRLWHAPEGQPRSYAPDNSPVEINIDGGRVIAIQEMEMTTGIQKEIQITMDDRGPHVEVRHWLINKNVWPVELAPWALTVMPPGGRSIIPLPPRGKHPVDLDVANPLAMWSYTDLSDKRWWFGSKYISLRQDSSATEPQKIGVGVPDGWAAFYRNGHLFVKEVRFLKDAHYPDFGSTFENFTNNEMEELESLGPLTRVVPGGKVEHVERWSLFKDVALDKFDDATIDRIVLPLVRKSP